jgi:hypothetical protein
MKQHTYTKNSQGGTKNEFGYPTLSFSDNRHDVTILGDINSALRTVGVYIGQVKIPNEAVEILQNSALRELNEAECSKILNIFVLNRSDIINQIKITGREPVVPGGGSLTTSEENMPSYPKIYDLKTLNDSDRLYVQNKFGALHSNYNEEGIGVDEIMTVLSGGPWTWFFSLDDNELVAKLTIPRINPTLGGWKLNYPGMLPHGALIDALDGICVAQVCGSQTWAMHYEPNDVCRASILGKNPWISLSCVNKI